MVSGVTRNTYLITEKKSEHKIVVHHGEKYVQNKVFEIFEEFFFWKSKISREKNISNMKILNFRCEFWKLEKFENVRTFLKR